MAPLTWTVNIIIAEIQTWSTNVARHSHRACRVVRGGLEGQEDGDLVGRPFQQVAIESIGWSQTVPLNIIQYMSHYRSFSGPLLEHVQTAIIVTDNRKI